LYEIILHIACAYVILLALTPPSDMLLPSTAIAERQDEKQKVKEIANPASYMYPDIIQIRQHDQENVQSLS
jgi:hypothetical protein